MKFTTIAAIIASATAISGAAAAQMAPEATMQPIPNPPEHEAMMHGHMMHGHMKHGHMMHGHMKHGHMMSKDHMADSKMSTGAMAPTSPKS